MTDTPCPECHPDRPDARVRYRCALHTPDPGICHECKKHPDGPHRWWCTHVPLPAANGETEAVRDV